MSKENMKILIVGHLDEQQTTSIINKQLRRIEKNLKLKLGIDNKQLADLVRDVEKIQSKLNRKVTPISEKDTKQAKVFVDSIEKAVEQYSKLGQVKVSQKINPNTKEIEAFTLAVTKADGKLKEFQFTQSKLKGIQGAGNYTLTGESLKDNTAQIRERQLQQEQQINRQIEQQNQKLKHQLEMYKQEANLKARNLINANQGNKNFDEASVRNWLNSVNALNTATPKVNQQMDRLRIQFRNINADAQASSNQVRNFGNTMENAFSRMPIYMAASAAIFAPFAIFNKLIDTLYVIDERLVTIDKVTENISMADVFDKASESAYRFGRTIDGALESFGEIVKLGFTAKEAGVLSDNSLMMATVGEMKDVDASNYLVAIMRQYKLQIEDTASAVDAFNELSNKSGATVQGLAQGLSKSSSSAAMAGVSFHELNGMMATTIETLKMSGNEAGNFYKTLFSRYLRERTQSALNEIGIQTKEMNGELRSATDVLQDLWKVWGKLDSQQKNAIASQLGGGWHIARTTSLIENQARAMQNTETSINSYNSAQKELETYQEGLRFKTNNMIASFQELAMTVGETGARDGIVKFLETVTSLTKGFTDLTEATHGWNIKLPILIGLAYGAVKAFGALKLAITGVRASLGIFSVGLVAVETLASMFMKSAKAANLNTEALTEMANKTSDQVVTLEDLIKKYNQLEPQAENNADKQKELQDVLSAIQQLAPHLIDSTGKYGDALTLNKEKADNYISSLKQMTKEQLALAKSANEIELSLINVDIDKEEKKLSKLEKAVKDSFNTMQEYQQKYGVQGLQDAEEEYEKRRAELAERASKASDKGNTDLSAKLTIELTEILNEYAEYVRIIEDKSNKLEEYTEKVGNLQELESKKDGIEERKKALEEFIKSTENGTLANQKNTDSLSKLAGGYYDSVDGMDASIDSMSNLDDAGKELINTYNNSISNIEKLNGIINDLGKSHKLSADNIGFLMEKYDHLLPYINDEAELRKRVQEEIVKEEQLAKKAILSKLSMNEQFYNSVLKANASFVNQFKSHYGIDLTNFKNLASAKLAVDNALRASLSKAWTSYSTQVNNAVSAMKLAAGGISGVMSGSLLQGLNAAKMAGEAYKYIVASNDFSGIFLNSVNADIGSSGLKTGTGSKNSSGSSGKDKTVDPYLSDKYAQSLDGLKLKLEQSEHKQSEMIETSKEYRKELQNQINIHNQLIKISLDEKERLEGRNKTLQANLKSMGAFNKLSNEQKEKYNQTAKEIDENSKAVNGLSSNILGYNEKIKGLSNNFLNSALDGLIERLDKSNQKYLDQIKIIEHLLDVSSGSEEEQIKLQGQKIFLLSKQKREIEDNIRLLESQNKNLINNKAALEKNVSETEKWKDVLMGVEQSTQSVYANIADKVINAQKEFYQEKLNAELDALEKRDKANQDSYDKERKAMEDNHKRQMGLLDKELKQYQRIIQAKLDSIDSLESERDYSKDLEKLTSEKLKIESQINKLSLDNSFEAIAKRIELEEQLRDKVEQIEELKHKREIELRKNSLQDDLEQKTEEINNAKDALQEKQDAEKDQLEKSHKALQDKLNADKEAIRKHYDNIINDERKWAKVREDIMKGNISSLTGELVGFSNDVNLNMTHMGDSIKNNLIDRLREAISLLQQFSIMGAGGFQTGINMPSNPKPSTGGSGSTGGTTSPAQPVMWNGLEFKQGQIGMVTVDKPINLWKRNNGKLEMVRILQAGEKYRVYGYDSQFGGQYDVGGGNWVTNMPSHIKYQTPSTDLLKKIQPFDTGGYTGDFKGGKLGILHEKELILNQGQTKDFLKAMTVLDGLKNYLPKLNTPTVNSRKEDLPPTEIIQIQEVNVHKPHDMDDIIRQVKGKVFGSISNDAKRRGIIIK
ncbi:phage tail tape measure protein [Bacillus sp. JJ1532]|uniref:phage tail tape measure protein n=1 Tax=Bacillus sp. JJ1532 TaxID=3122958 RepID=UPI002FFF475B